MTMVNTDNLPAQLLVLLLILLYFLPAIIADRRRHHNRFAILVANLFLAWTVLGWFLILVWSCTAVREATTV